MNKKILLCAYAISPTRGSEYSSAWNYIIEMSKDNILVVLFGASGNHMGNIEEMESWLKSNSISNVTFVPVIPDGLTSILNFLNRKGIFPYAFYFAFRYWHLQVYNTAKRLINNEHFDLIHNFNPTGYREPGYLWKLKIPYIWGPIGGAQNRPTQIFKSLSTKNKIFFTIRNWINTIQFNYKCRLKKAINETDLLLCSTIENKILFENKFIKSATYIPENAINNSAGVYSTRIISLKKGDLCNILWIGSIDARKSLNFLIDALGNIKIKNWHLHVLGNGSLKPEMQKLAEKNQINGKISWHGHIPRSEVFRLLQSGHLHVITSLGEGTPTILWEAMANGIPTISLDHCGMKDVICERCGVKIDIKSVDQVKNDLTDAISDLIQNPEKINKLSMGVQECAKLHTWEHRRQIFNGYYDLAIENWKKKMH